MSKNNFTERLRKMEPKKDHYSIRKFSVGVASVLIGFSFLGLGNTPEVKADATGQSQTVETNKSEANEKNEAAQDNQNKDVKDNVSVDNDNKQSLDVSQKLAVQALKNRSIAAAARKDSNLNISESAGKVKADIGLSGLKDTNAESKNVEKKSDRNSEVDAKETNASKTNEVKSDIASSSADSKKSSNDDYKVDTQDLDTLTVNKAENDKFGKKDQADELAKELGADLTTDKSGKISKLALKGNGTEDKLASGTEQTLNTNKTAAEDVAKQKNLQGSKKLARLYGNNLDEETPTQVSTFADLSRAIINKNIHNIVLTGNIDLSNLTDAKSGISDGLVSGGNHGDYQAHSGAAHELTTWGAFMSNSRFKNIARSLTIDGGLDPNTQKPYILNMGKWYFSLTNNTIDNDGWHITLKDLNLVADNNSYSPFNFGHLSASNQKKSSISFDNVTATLIGRSLSGSDNTNVSFNGTNTITETGQSNGNLINGANISFSGTNTITEDGESNGDLVKGSNVTFNGDTILTAQNLQSQNVINAKNVDFVSGTTTINASSTLKSSSNKMGNAVYTTAGDQNGKASVTIENGAVLTINGGYKDKNNVDHPGLDIRGIVVNDYNSNNGTLQVDGTYNANMAKGHSSAIVAANLNIGSTGNVTIKTAQDNETDGTENSVANQNTNYNGTHFAPITLGVNKMGNTIPASWQKNNLIDNGSLTIIRDVSNSDGTTSKTMTPLISIGIGTGAQGGALNYATYNMTVGKGATLDLEDNSTPMNNGALGNTGYYTNTPKHGLITMWGDAANSSLNFDDPQYVNLQRTGSSTGGLILIQQSSNKNNSSVNLTGTLPVAQWDEGNKTADPSFVWYINNLKTWNHPTDYADTGFTQAGTTGNGGLSNGTDKLINSNAQVTMGENQSGQDSYQYNGSLAEGQRIVKGNPNSSDGLSYYNPDLNQFLNNFSWWKPQRLTFGSKKGVTPSVKDNVEYQPEVKTITTDTTHKLSDDLNDKDGIHVKDGITDLIGPDGKISYDGKIDWAKTHWYSATKDGNDWNKIMGSGQNPVAAATNSDGTLKVTAPNSNTSNTATVVYTDGSIDFVNIPIKVTAPSDSTLYNAHYQGATVKQGQTGTIAKPSISKKSDGSVAPNTVTETYKRTSDTPSWVTVNNEGSLTLEPTTSTTVGMYNVPVLVTYNDNSSETVYAPVYVTNDDNHHVIWGKDGRSAVIVVTQPVTLHETSDNSMVTTSYAGQAVKGFDIYTKDTSNSDKVNTTVDSYTYKNGQYQNAVGHDLGSITVSWASDPTTTVTTPSLNVSKSPRLKITFNAGSSPVVDGIFDAGETNTVKSSLSLNGATEKTGYTSVDVVRGQQPTSDQLATLVDHSKLDDLPDGMAIDKYELKPGTSLDTSTKGKKSVTIRILFKDKDAQGKETYLDLPAITDGINVIDNDSDTYDAHYQGTTVKQGETGTVAIPSIDKKSDGTAAPTTVTETYKSTSDTPSWVTVDNKGSLTLKPTTSTTVGMYNIPVLVTYNDNSTETVYAPVYVTKDDVHHVTWGKDGHSAVVTVTQPVTLHQTSDSSMVTKDYAGQTVKEFDVYTKDAANADRISTTADAYVSKDGQYKDTAGNNLGSVTVAWNSDPSTVVTAPSLSSSKTAEIKITFDADSVPVSDGIFDTDKSDTANVSLDLRGATEKTGYTSIEVVRGQQPTSDQLASLVDHSKLDNLPDGIKVDHYELVGTLDTSTTGKKDVTIRIVFKDKNSSSKKTYLDLPAITNGIDVIASEADKYVPSYRGTTLRPGQSVSVNPSWKDSKTPTGESFALVAGGNTPTWVTINSSNGKITFAPSADVNDNAYRVPVKVTYQDGSSATVYAPVYVTDGQHTATWDEGMTTMYEGPVATYHKTTNSNDLDIKNSRLVNIYNWDEHNNETIWTLKSESDGDYYVETRGAHLGSKFAASDITYTWITNLKGVSEPSTNVDAFGGDTGSLLYLNSDGTVNKKEQTGPDEDLYGNSKWRYHFTIGGDAPTDIDVPAGMWANIYFNFLGATGNTDIPVNVGDTVPTDANSIKKYLRSTDVINPPVSGQSYGAIHKDWTVTKISWENGDEPGSNGKFDANNLNGTVRLDFKNANGGTSYLDVKVSFKTGSYVPHNNNNDNKNDDTNLYVTRTIHYDVPAGETAIPDKVQPVHYIRDGHHKVDSQGNDLPEVVWNDWKLADGQTAKFPEIETVNQFTGYDSYVNYGDGKDAQKSETVASANVSVDNGKPQDGKEVTITYVKQDATPIKYDPNSTDDNMIVHRRITYDVSGTGHAAIDSVDQKVDYVRDDAHGNAGYKDPVTGKITYVAWTVKNGGSASFPVQDITQITGYDSYVDYNDGQGVKKSESISSADVAEDKDGKPQNADDVTITYKASDQSVKFEFWDDTDNKEIGSDHTVKGTTDQTVTTNLTAPANYDLAKGNDSETDLYNVPASYKFGASNPAVIKIHFVHGTETITHDKPSTTIKGAEASDLTTKVTRKVTINTPATDGQTAKSDIKDQEVDFGRSVKVDKVTGKIISYSDWQVISTNSTLAEVDAPTVAGYTPTVNKADEITPKAGDKVADVTINYNANDQHIDYQFVDDDNNGSNVGSAILVTGKTDETVDPSQTVKIPAGYKLAVGQSIPTSYKFKASGNDPVTIHLVHGTKIVQPGETPNPGTKVPGDNGHKTPGDGRPKNDINYTDLHKDITRTITDYIPGQAVPTVTTQKVSYERTATIDDVTGDVTYGDWTVSSASKEKSLAEYDVKAHSGYTPSITKVDAETPTSYQVQNWTDPNIVIKYTAGSQSMTYTFVDDDNHGATVGSPVTITGNTGQNVPTGLEVPDGYKLADGQATPPTSYTFKSTNPGVDIHLKHVISPVIKHGNEPKPGDKIPGTKGKTYPDDVTRDKNFEHDVTRTVTINYPSGPQIVVQKVHFERTGTVDAVTGTITYTSWTEQDNYNDSFAEVDAKVVQGYVADKAKADKVTGVKESDSDSTVTINYNKVGSYVPVDDKGNQLPGTNKTPYTNDPTDPTKVLTKVPTIPGYTPTHGSSQTPADPSKDTNVTYTADNQHIDYQFVDDDNKDTAGNPSNVGSVIEVDGKTDETVDPSKKLTIPAGYQLASGQSIPTSVKLSLDNPLLGKTVKVHLVHGTKTVNPDDPGVDPTDSKYSDLFKTAHRKIYETKPSQSQQLIDTQTVQFGRSGTEDLVTGKITATGSWVAGQIEDHRFVAGGDSNFASENIASQSGYTTYVAYGNAARQEANAVKQESALNDKNIPTDADPVYITFESNKAGDINYSQNIVYVYKPDNTTISTASDAITGSFKSGSSATVTADTQKAAIESHMPENYVIDQDYPKDETINSANPKALTVYVKHATKEIKPTDPGVDPKNSQYSDMFTTVKRDIEVTDPGQTTPVDHQQSVKLERSKTIDLVTNKISYGKWQFVGTEIHVGGIETYSESPLEFPEWAVPQYDGYTSYVGNEASKEVKAASIIFDQNGDPQKGDTVYVTYKKINNGGGNPGSDDHQNPPTQGQIIIKYVDPDGKTVHTVTVPVDKGSTIDPSGAIESNVPKGYKLPDGYTAPTSASEGSTISVSIVPTNHKSSTPGPTPGRGGHKPTHNNGGKSSHKGNSRKTNAPKHNAKSSSNSLPLGENGRLGNHNGNRSGGYLAPQGQNNGNGQNGANNAVQNASHNAKTLPQTGENSHKTAVLSTIGMLGLTAAGIVALLALGGDRKRR